MTLVVYCPTRDDTPIVSTATCQWIRPCFKLGEIGYDLRSMGAARFIYPWHPAHVWIPATKPGMCRLLVRMPAEHCSLSNNVLILSYSVTSCNSLSLSGCKSLLVMKRIYQVPNAPKTYFYTFLIIIKLRLLNSNYTWLLGHQAISVADIGNRTNLWFYTATTVGVLGLAGMKNMIVCEKRVLEHRKYVMQLFIKLYGPKEVVFHYVVPNGC